MPREYDDDDERDTAPQRKKKRRRRRSNAGLTWFGNLDPQSQAIFGGGGAGFIFLMLGFAFPKLAWGAVVIGGLLVVAGNLLFLFAALAAGTGVALACLFVPFFSLYFFLTNIDDTWRCMVMCFVGGILLFVGYGITELGFGRGSEPDRIPNVPATQDPPGQSTPRGNSPNPFGKPEPPSAPPLPEVDPVLLGDDDVVFLCDLKMHSVKSGLHPVMAKRTREAPFGDPIKVKGKFSEHGISMPPPSGPERAAASYALGGKATRFIGWVALNDTRFKSDVREPVYFRILGDGKELWESSATTRANPAEKFEVDVKKVKVLTLETRVGGLSFLADAVWYEPHLEK